MGRVWKGRSERFLCQHHLCSYSSGSSSIPAHPKYGRDGEMNSGWVIGRRHSSLCCRGRKNIIGYSTCLSHVAIVVLTPSRDIRGRTYFVITWSSSFTEGKHNRNSSKAGTQERKQWRNAVYWLALHSLFSLLSPTPRLTCPWVTQPSVGWVLPHQPSIKKISHRLACRPIWQAYFLSWGSIFQDDPSLC